jgi:hypothetical protein
MTKTQHVRVPHFCAAYIFVMNIGARRDDDAAK